MMKNNYWPRSWDFVQSLRRRSSYKSLDECAEIKALFDLRKATVRKNIERTLFMYENLMGLPWGLDRRGQRLHHLATIDRFLDNQESMD